MIEPSHDFQIVRQEQTGATRSLAKADARANPFKIVIDPKVRLDLKRALFELIDYHDEALAEHFADGKLALDSYKEYVELFARSLKETMESREGVSYLLRSVGFDVPAEEINLDPELRWKKGPAPFGVSLL
jgi:riboflavin biosynthesis pyrimidine reductase